MMTEKDKMRLNAGTVDRSVLLEESNVDAKILGMRVMSRLYNMVERMACEIKELKSIVDPVTPASPMDSWTVRQNKEKEAISEEERKAIKQKMYDFIISKLDYMKEVAKESLTTNSGEEVETSSGVTVYMAGQPKE